MKITTDGPYDLSWWRYNSVLSLRITPRDTSCSSTSLTQPSSNSPERNANSVCNEETMILFAIMHVPPHTTHFSSFESVLNVSPAEKPVLELDRLDAWIGSVANLLVEKNLVAIADNKTTARSCEVSLHSHESAHRIHSSVHTVLALKRTQCRHQKPVR